MKNYLFLGLFVSICMNLYLINIKYDELEPSSLELRDQVKIAQSSVSKETKSKTDCSDKKIKTTQIISPSLKKSKELEISEEEMYEKFAMLKANWIEKSEIFFIDELELSSDQIATYRALSIRRDQEVSEYFNSKNSQEDKSYMLSTNDTIFMGRLAEKYENLLKSSFGEQSYISHREFIEKNNSRVDSEGFVQLIEF